jgi:hypothetical protein
VTLVPIAKLLLKDFQLALIILCTITIVLMAYKRLAKEFVALTAITVVLLIRSVVGTALLFHRKDIGLPLATAYQAYFSTYWMCAVLSSVFQVLVIYSVFSAAMRPLEGLHQIGKVIFRWAAAVSSIIAMVVAVGSRGVLSTTSNTAFVGMVHQVNQAIGVLTLCLLVFVCLSARPLGLTYRSRIFGIALGLGVMATTTLVQLAWSGISPTYSLYSPIAAFGVIGEFCAVAVWGTYFILPEPARRLILLPTTSPYFFWNKLSEALGDAPGHVAVGGFTSSMLSDAEVAMFSAPDSDVPNRPIKDFDAPSLQQPSLANAS